MKNNFLLFFKKSYLSYFLFALVISFILFRGRLGSDDLEVFNYIYDFNQFEGSYFEFFKHLSTDQKLFYDDAQKHTFYTTLHRLTWLLQTGIIYFITYEVLSFFEIDNFFFIQYFSGYILTLCSVMSIFLFNKILQDRDLNKIHSTYLSIIIFFGTSLIFLLTGQYLESLSIFLILNYIYFSNIYIRFAIGLLLLFTKPFYILVIFGLRVNELNNKNFYLNFLNFKKIIDLILLVFSYLIIFIFLSYALGDTEFILSYFTNQHPTFDILKNFKNLFKFYFATGAGTIFSLFIPFMLIVIGFNKNTILKLLIIFLMSCILSLWVGFHGAIPGSRHILAFIFMFIDEYVIAIKYMINKKNKFIFIILSILTILNLPSLEYRNFAITEYSSGTINTMKAKGPTISWTEVEKGKIDDYVYFDWPVNNYKFNSIYFGNYIVINKLLSKTDLSIANINFEADNVFPQSGLARLIYIHNKNINVKHKFITNILYDYYDYFLFLYVFVLFSFIIFICTNLKKIIKFSDRS